MITARIKIQPDITLPNGDVIECWDNVLIVVQESPSLSLMIPIHDRGDVLDAYSQISLAHISNHSEPLDVNIGKHTYNFSYSVWQAIGGVLECFVDEYFLEFHSNTPNDLDDSNVATDSPGLKLIEYIDGSENTIK